jgi:hypothetical protein
MIDPASLRLCQQKAPAPSPLRLGRSRMGWPVLFTSRGGQLPPPPGVAGEAEGAEAQQGEARRLGNSGASSDAQGASIGDLDRERATVSRNRVGACIFDLS